MNINNEVSPFKASHPLWEPYIKGLGIFKVLGLPFRIIVNEGNKIVFEDHLRLLKYGCIIGKIRFKTLNS